MERRQLESAAVSYAGMRGLFGIPIGLTMIVMGLGSMGWGPFRELWMTPLVLLPVALATLPITRYYNDSYGQVTLCRGSQFRTLAAILVAMPLLFAGMRLDERPGVSIWALLASWSLMMLVCYVVSAGLRTHRLVVWGSLLVASLLPVWTGLGPSLKRNAAFVVAGVAIMATGLLDHRMLVRRFGSPGNRDLEGGDVGA